LARHSTPMNPALPWLRVCWCLSSYIPWRRIRGLRALRGRSWCSCYSQMIKHPARLCRLSINVAMSATMAIILGIWNARVYVKFIARTTAHWRKASESKSEKQYGNQLCHFFPLDANRRFPDLVSHSVWGTQPFTEIYFSMTQKAVFPRQPFIW